jgi:hypothetical protein
LRSELPYGALLAYSPRGQSEVSKRSQEVCYRVKAGEPAILQRAIQLLREHVARSGVLSSFFGRRVTLVPMPRSAPLVPGALWPADAISKSFLDAGLVGHVVPALARNSAVPKSSRAPRGERPAVSRHYESMTARAMVGVSETIVIVDDVVTKGSTALAAASRLADVYHEADIRLFALIRTKGRIPEVDQILDPETGLIRLVGDEGDRQP